MSRKRWRFRLYAGAALAAGLLLRLWFVLHLPRVAGDSLIYGAIARNWIQHGVYGFGQTTMTGTIVARPTLIRLPGYPLFLVACFRLFGMENYRAVMGMQVIVDLATCWLASALSGRLFGGRAALIVLWLAVLCPFTANYVATPLTETLVLTSIALTFYGFARWQDAGAGYNRWLWTVGAALASSLLLRPEQGLLAAVVLPAMLWVSLRRRERQRRAFVSALPVLAAACCVMLPLLPWTIRNWRTFHVFQPLAPRYANDPGELAPVGFGRWYRTWAIEFSSTDEVYWNYNGDQIRLADLPARAFNASSLSQREDLYARTAALLADYDTTATATPAIDARFAALAAERVAAHPILYYVALPFARVLDMALRPRVEMMQIPDEWWRRPTPIRQIAFAASYAVLNLLYVVLGLAGFCAWRRCERPSGTAPYEFRELAFAMAASLILRCALLLTLDNSEPRYTLEFFPILFVWTGALFASPTPLASTPPSGGG